MSRAFPSAFEQELRARLGESDAARLLDALSGEVATSVRFNPYKLSEKPEGRQVPWNRYGFLLDERPVFTLDPALHGGAYYVQEASSMFIEHIFRAAFGDDPRRMRVLDMCASPGGKTTLLSTLAGLESTVVANEAIRQRVAPLADNVGRWGLGNVAVTSNDPSHFGALREYFDLVLVDAPCSGEGMFRKNPEARAQWSIENVKLCAARQKRILADAWASLKPGGVLIYSTCTFNAAENEDNVAWLEENYDTQPVEVDIPAEWGVERGFSEGGVNTFRFWPHRVEGEGFFAAVLRKTEGKVRMKVTTTKNSPLSELPRPTVKEAGRWVAQPEFMHFAQAGENIYGYYEASYADIRTLSETLSVVYSGVQMGQQFKGRLRPAHPLALFHDVNRNAVPVVDIPLDQAQAYLRRNDIDVAPFAEGMNLVSWEGLPIGWIKRIGGRANNLYPKELRIATL